MDRLLSSLAEVTVSMGAVIALLLLCAPALARRFRPQWRCWAWLAVALRLAVPLNLPAPAPAVRLPGPPVAVTAVLPAAPAPRGQEGDAASPREELFGAAPEKAAPAALPWRTILAALWLGGAGVFLCAEWGAYFRFRRRTRRASHPAGEEEGRLLAEAAAQAGVSGAAVDLRVCPGIPSPVLAGFFRPTVLLPEGMDPAALPFALLHELTHLRRRDLWCRALLVWCNALHWFNPLVWWMRRRAERDMEAACDAALLEGRDASYRRAYGGAILAGLTAGRRSAAALASHFSGDAGGLKRRFRALLAPSPRQPGRAALALVAAACLLGGALVACGPAADPAPTAAALADGTYYAMPYFETIPQDAADWDSLDALTFQLADLEEDGMVYYGVTGDPVTLPLAADAPLTESNGTAVEGLGNFLRSTFLRSYWPALIKMEVSGGEIASLAWVLANAAPTASVALDPEQELLDVVVHGVDAAGGTLRYAVDDGNVGPDSVWLDVPAAADCAVWLEDLSQPHPVRTDLPELEERVSLLSSWGLPCTLVLDGGEVVRVIQRAPGAASHGVADIPLGTAVLETWEGYYKLVSWDGAARALTVDPVEVDRKAATVSNASAETETCEVVEDLPIVSSGGAYLGEGDAPPAMTLDDFFQEPAEPVYDGQTGQLMPHLLHLAFDEAGRVCEAHWAVGFPIAEPWN